MTNAGVVGRHLVLGRVQYNLLHKKCVRRELCGKECPEAAHIADNLCCARRIVARL